MMLPGGGRWARRGGGPRPHYAAAPAAPWRGARRGGAPRHAAPPPPPRGLGAFPRQPAPPRGPAPPPRRVEAAPAPPRRPGPWRGPGDLPCHPAPPPRRVPPPRAHVRGGALRGDMRRHGPGYRRAAPRRDAIGAPIEVLAPILTADNVFSSSLPLVDASGRFLGYVSGWAVRGLRERVVSGEGALHVSAAELPTEVRGVPMLLGGGLRLIASNGDGLRGIPMDLRVLPAGGPLAHGGDDRGDLQLQRGEGEVRGEEDRRVSNRGRADNAVEDYNNIGGGDPEDLQHAEEPRAEGLRHGGRAEEDDGDGGRAEDAEVMRLRAEEAARAEDGRAEDAVEVHDDNAEDAVEVHDIDDAEARRARAEAEARAEEAAQIRERLVYLYNLMNNQHDQVQGIVRSMDRITADANRAKDWSEVAKALAPLQHARQKLTNSFWLQHERAESLRQRQRHLQLPVLEAPHRISKGPEQY
ncbi:unnamed protein product [Urochloa decumbens]|uniref:Uncharacterized protein n=1 Tax=Urochloa decumbens TaxID=240449 RepID=A0ABC9BMF3_9POAL